MGRFAALTNYRDGRQPKLDSRSRGALVADFLTGDSAPEAYLSGLMAHSSVYNGFNLLVGDPRQLGYFSNRDRDNPGFRWLEPGIYGLSNHVLDTPWPKLTAAKTAFAAALDVLPEPKRFFALLADNEIFPDADLPDTGVPPHWERALSAIFVDTPDYGTRASTLLTVHRSGKVTVWERSFGPGATPLGEAHEIFQSSEISTGV